MLRATSSASGDEPREKQAKKRRSRGRSSTTKGKRVHSHVGAMVNVGFGVGQPTV
jgi:hypothetical protein